MRGVGLSELGNCTGFSEVHVRDEGVLWGRGEVEPPTLDVEALVSLRRCSSPRQASFKMGRFVVIPIRVNLFLVSLVLLQSTCHHLSVVFYHM